MDHRMPGFPIHHQLPELAQTHVYCVSDGIHPSHPLSSPSPHAFSLSSIRVFSNESAFRIRWPKYWSFSFNISSSNEHSGLISFRMNWLRSRKLPELMVLSLPFPQQLKFYYQPLPKQLTDFRKAEKCSWHASTSSNIFCFLLLLLLFIFITCTQYWYIMDRQWKIT